MIKVGITVNFEYNKKLICFNTFIVIKTNALLK